MEFAKATKSKTNNSTDEWYTSKSAVYPKRFSPFMYVMICYQKK